MQMLTAGYPGALTPEVGKRHARPDGVHSSPETSMLLHDLRKLVQAICGPLDTLEISLDEPNIETAKNCLGRIRNNVSCLGDMLGHMYPATADDRTGKGECDVAQVIESVVDLLAPSLKEEGVSIETRLKGTARVSIDKTELHRVFLNLIVNAVQAMDGCGDSIIIEVEPVCGEWIGIAVRDNGCGIAPENLPRIFGEGKTTKETQGGSGLGLAIVKRFVEEAGGDIQVHSECGKGTQFVINLPNGKNGNGRSADLAFQV